MKPYRCNQCLQKHYRSGECGLEVWSKYIGDLSVEGVWGIFCGKVKDMEIRLARGTIAFEELADTVTRTTKDFQRLDNALQILKEERNPVRTFGKCLIMLGIGAAWCIFLIGFLIAVLKFL